MRVATAAWQSPASCAFVETLNLNRTGQLDVDPTFTILFDKDSKVSNSFRVNGLPTTYLIDKQGNIRYRAIGGREFGHPEVEKQIMQLMQE